MTKRRRIPDHLRLAFLRFAAEVAERRRHLWTDERNIPGYRSTNRGRHRRLWADEERAYLRKNHAATSNKELARVLDRTVGAISWQAHVMGLYKEWSGRGEAAQI